MLHFLRKETEVANGSASPASLRKCGNERCGIRPGYAVDERSPPTGEWFAERGLDPGAATCRVERLSRRILGKHPEGEAPVGWAASDQLTGCFGQQPSADAVPLELIGHVQVVQECAEVGVLVKDHVNEADDLAALEGSDSEMVRAWSHQSRAPHRAAVGEHIPI